MEKKIARNYLQKGINFMAGALFLLITTPIVITIGFKAQQKADINFILYIGIVLAIAAIIVFAMGINYLLKHLFKDK